MSEQENFLILTAYLKVGSLFQSEKSYIKQSKKRKNNKQKTPHKKSTQTKTKTPKQRNQPNIHPNHQNIFQVTVL